MEDEQKVLQNKLLDMAKIFHDFCVSHNLKYYMISGTMLGAIRHGGFIPWDDDIDFGMMREDYDRMLSLRNELPEGFTFNDHLSNKKFKYGFCKMYDENTTYIESAIDTHYIGGVYIDIFPFDNMGNDLQKALKMSKKIKRRKRIRSVLYTKGKRTTALKSFIVKTMQLVLPENYRWYEWPYKVLKRYKGTKSKYVANVYGAAQPLPIEFFGEPKLYKFEDTYLYGLEDYDGYLKATFGDYMTPPPVEAREKHAISYINYDLPYKEYVKEKENKG